MQAISLNSVEAALFDLGGVVIETDFDQVFAHWAEHSHRLPDAIKAKFSFDDFYQQHERGEISASEYFAALRGSLGINISDIQFIAGWNAIYGREVPGIAVLLQRLKEKVPLYAFTNSNPTHQQVWSKRFAEVLSLFHTVFVSSELGKRKPEPEAFRLVAEAIGIPLSRIVFFDDTWGNVEAARILGMPAVQVRSLADIEDSVRDIIG